MQILFIIISFIFMNVGAVACGLQADTSIENLIKIIQKTDSPATEYLPKTIMTGAHNLFVKNSDGKEIKTDEALVLSPGMTITAQSGKAKIYIPTTGQSIDLESGSTLKVLSYVKSKDQKICSLSFELQSGKAEFSSNHQEREGQCLPKENVFEVTTQKIEITPIGTKYSVDLNQAIAEANGETYNEEEVAVKNGQVKIRLVKIKNKNVSKNKKTSLASNDENYDEEKPIIVKAGKKARVTKTKKDQLADIQIVYPED